MAFDTQITDLVGGTIDQAACDQWAADACKEIIHQLPEKLKVKCSTISIINATNGTTLDLDGKGDILNVTRLSADSGGYYKPCREIPSKYGDLANDSTDLNYYATASDPVYYITSNSSGAVTLFVKPTTTDAQPANAYHITYPSVDVSGVSTIANFPDEAEHLVVLYVASRQLLQYQSTMSSSFNSDITTALTATNTELDETQAICDLMNTQIDSAVTQLGEAATQVDSGIDTALSAITTAAGRINTAVGLANAEFDLANPKVDDEDIELAQGYLATGSAYLNEAASSASEASAYASEVNARISQVSGYSNVIGGYISAASGYASELSSKIAIATGYINEANARLQQDVTKYQWYGDQYAKLSAEYQRGLAALKGA